MFGIDLSARGLPQLDRGGPLESPQIRLEKFTGINTVRIHMSKYSKYKVDSLRNNVRIMRMKSWCEFLFNVFFGIKLQNWNLCVSRDWWSTKNFTTKKIIIIGYLRHFNSWRHAQKVAFASPACYITLNQSLWISEQSEILQSLFLFGVGSVNVTF